MDIRDLITIINESSSDFLTEGFAPLPLPGQKPWWIEPLAEMTRELSEFEGWTWTTGGCFAFARALKIAYGGNLWGVCRFSPASGEWDDDLWDVDHAVVKIGSTFYDYNGVFDPDTYIAKLRSKIGDHIWKMKSKNSNGVAYMEDDFLDDEQWKALPRILRYGRR